MSLTIRKAAADDARAICDIYNHYVANTIITFEQEAVTPDEMRERIAGISSHYPWLVAQSERGIAGYAYAGRWRTRAAYDRTAETTVYVDRALLGSGVGKPLYAALLDALRAQSIHAAVGCIALPNPASVAFHEKCGFRKVGHFPEVGRKFGQWVDVGFWQIVL